MTITIFRCHRISFRQILLLIKTSKKPTKLFQVNTWNVLLIEAGEDEQLIMDVPVIAHYLQFTEANWKYKTEPSDKYCLGDCHP